MRAESTCSSRVFCGPPSNTVLSCKTQTLTSSQFQLYSSACYCCINKLTKWGFILRNSDTALWQPIFAGSGLSADPCNTAPTVRTAYWPAVTNICPFIYSWFIIIVLLSITQNNDAFLGLKSKVASVCAGWIALYDVEKSWCNFWDQQCPPEKKGQEKLQRNRSAW